MPGASSEMFRHVCNLTELKPEEPNPGLGRKAAEVGADVGAGVGGGIAGCAVGFLTVAIGSMLFPPMAPLALGFAALGGMTGGGIAAGTASAIPVGSAAMPR